MAEEDEGVRQSFGKRRPASEDRPSPDKDPSKPPVKRSQTVSLVLLGGAVAAAVAFAQHDPSQDEEDVLIYTNAEACIRDRLRTEADCRNDESLARRAYTDAPPRYDTMTDCEGHHGPSRCVAGAAVAESARWKYVPLMSAYLLGRRPEQGIAPQPLFDHAPQNAAAAASNAGFGGYCTRSGGRIWPASGGRSPAARVSSSVTRGTSFGGFGSTGRAFSSSSRGFFGGG